MGRGELVISSLPMRKILVTYATDGTKGSYDFTPQQDRINAEVRLFGIEHFYSWTYRRLQQTQFYVEHKEVLDDPPQGGHCLWKPYIILDAINASNPGDLILYLDADIRVTPHAAIDKLLSIAEQRGVCLVEGGPFCNYAFVQASTLRRLDAEDSEFLNRYQLWAAISAWRACPETVKLLQCWLDWCCDHTLLLQQKGEENHPDFVFHGQEQALLSILAYKEELPVLGNPEIQGFQHPTR